MCVINQVKETQASFSFFALRQATARKKRKKIEPTILVKKNYKIQAKTIKKTQPPQPLFLAHITS